MEYWWNDINSVNCWWNDTDRGKPKYWEKNVPVPLCPPQIPYTLPWYRNSDAAVKGRRLTAWDIARCTVSAKLIVLLVSCLTTLLVTLMLFADCVVSVDWELTIMCCHLRRYFSRYVEREQWMALRFWSGFVGTDCLQVLTDPACLTSSLRLRVKLRNK
jgi:hypothetical protein